MAQITQAHLKEYIDLCEEKWGIKVVEKKYSWLMRAIGKLLFFNKGFMDHYITTIGRTVYWPNLDDALKNPDGMFDTYFHEAQHGHDFIRFSVFFILSYISPQIWMLLFPLAFLGISHGNAWWLFLLCVPLIGPIPSYFRAMWEWRGSSCNIALSIWRYGTFSDGHKEALVRRFKGPDYYYMWPFPKWFRKKLAKIEEKIRAGKLTTVQRETYKFLQDRAIV